MVSSMLEMVISALMLGEYVTTEDDAEKLARKLLTQNPEFEEKVKKAKRLLESRCCCKTDARILDILKTQSNENHLMDNHWISNGVNGWQPLDKYPLLDKALCTFQFSMNIVTDTEFVIVKDSNNVYIPYVLCQLDSYNVVCHLLDSSNSIMVIFDGTE